jgi:hypothetical protein
MTRGIRLLVITGVTLAAILGIMALPPISQSQDYHNFAD